jgi:hypothetical protein|tara:strand:- start:4272 stop:4490 length:219 start_codon:yes stop_codon:yes gene_type:complete
MKIYEILESQAVKDFKTRYDHHYGYDPELLSYQHEIGKIYGKKNLKVPHAKYSISKRAKQIYKGKNGSKNNK